MNACGAACQAAIRVIHSAHRSLAGCATLEAIIVPDPILAIEGGPQGITTPVDPQWVEETAEAFAKVVKHADRAGELASEQALQPAGE